MASLIGNTLIRVNGQWSPVPFRDKADPVLRSVNVRATIDGQPTWQSAHPQSYTSALYVRAVGSDAVHDYYDSEHAPDWARVLHLTTRNDPNWRIESALNDWRGRRSTMTKVETGSSWAALGPEVFTPQTDQAVLSAFAQSREHKTYFNSTGNVERRQVISRSVLDISAVHTALSTDYPTWGSNGFGWYEPLNQMQLRRIVLQVGMLVDISHGKLFNVSTPLIEVFRPGPVMDAAIYRNVATSTGASGQQYPPPPVADPVGDPLDPEGDAFWYRQGLDGIPYLRAIPPGQSQSGRYTAEWALNQYDIVNMTIDGPFPTGGNLMFDVGCESLLNPDGLNGYHTADVQLSLYNCDLHFAMPGHDTPPDTRTY